MYTLAVIIHVIVCFLMIASILLQAGKGAEMGAAFGGSSQTVFGSRGPGTFLSKVTIGAAVIFMVTSLGLAILSKERTFSSTVIDLNKKETSPAPATSPSTPASEAPKAAPPGEGTAPTPAPATP
ncbi:MAG TPA: preprotein translocase subunit SecG [Nitrospiraceae bacterium]|nr:preprotein translocase subunit SecG [Nitrospiraceae bacterium]